MRFARFSIAGLIGTIGFCAVAMACLMFASSAWTGAVLSVTLGLLTLAPLGIVYRHGARRAFWAGVVLCGWAYMILSSGPWFVTSVRPQLATSMWLDWAYPWLIPAARQSANPRLAPRPFFLPPAALEGGLTTDELNGSRVDVWVKGEGKARPSLLVEGVLSKDGPMGPNEDSGPTVMADAGQFAKLARAVAYSQEFILRPHESGPFDPLWSSPPVQRRDFENVGHALFGLISAWVGGMAGGYFHATRDRGAPGAASGY